MEESENNSSEMKPNRYVLCFLLQLNKIYKLLTSQLKYSAAEAENLQQSGHISSLQIFLHIK
jgi:hypothetical protein